MIREQVLKCKLWSEMGGKGAENSHKLPLSCLLCSKIHKFIILDFTHHFNVFDSKYLASDLNRSL